MHDNSRALLRASIAFDGRAFTVYEEVYAERTMNSDKAHKTFLKGLKAVLPPDCCPIICTDAGFKVPWIKEVESYHWYWLARVRGTVQCSTDKGLHWNRLSYFYKQATTKAKKFPSLWLSKAAEHECRAVLYRCAYPPKLKTAPKRPNCNAYKKHLKSAKDPWLLASNVPETILNTKDIVNAYRRRMTIEEAFRDSKNEYYGLGLRRSRSKSIERLQTLLLILLVAQWQLYLIGRAAENKGIHLQFQANTITSRRVLSYCYLARRVLLHARYTFTEKQLKTALSELIELTKIGRT